MRLFRYELKKLFVVKWFIILLTVFFCASCAVHIFNTNGYRNKAQSKYTDEESRVIDAFVHEYGLDDEKYTEYKNAVEQLKNSISEQINEECTKAYQEGKSEEEIRAIWTDQKRYETHIYSGALTDDVLQNEMAAYQTARNEYLAAVGIITDQARQNAETLRKDQGMGINDPLYQYQVFVYDTYDTVKNNAVVGIDKVVGWDRLLTYNYSDIFLFVSLILIAGAVFLTEDQTGMTPILRTTKKGRLHTAAAKTSAVLCGGAVLTLLYSFASYLIVLSAVGYSDPNVSVQNIKAFTAFPYVFSILQFYLYGLMLKVLSAAAFSALCGLLAVLLRQQAFYYGSSAALFGLSFALGKIPGSEHPMLHGLNLYSICNVVPATERLYVFQPFLSCISYNVLAPVLCGIIIVISVVFTVISFCAVRYAGRTRITLFSDIAAKIKKAVKPKKTVKRKKKTNYTKSIFSWESKKALTANLPVLLLVILLLLTQIAVCIVNRVNTEPDRETRIYNRFILPETEGKFSENGDKCGFMIDIFTLQKKDQYDQTFEEAIRSGVITVEESERIRESLEFIDKNELNGNFNYAREKYDKALKLYEKGLDAEFIDETGVQPIVTGGAPYALYAAVLFVCISLQMLEYGGKSKNENFANILRTAKNGRKKTFVSKLCAAVVISAALSVIFNVIEFLTLTIGRDLSCLNAPIYSVTAFADAEISLTIIQYIIIMYACRVLISVLFAIFVSAVASLAKNLTISFAAVAGSTLLPTLLYSSGLHSAGHVSFCDFFGVNGMILFSSDFHVFAVYAAVFTAVTAALTVISARKFIK